MPDKEPPARGGESRAHETVRRLRAHAEALGLPRDQISQILPVSDIRRRFHVRLGTLTIESAEALLGLLDAGTQARAGTKT
jgi:hypothetical protein